MQSSKYYMAERSHANRWEGAMNTLGHGLVRSVAICVLLTQVSLAQDLEDQVKRTLWSEPIWAGILAVCFAPAAWILWTTQSRTALAAAISRRNEADE